MSASIVVTVAGIITFERLPQLAKALVLIDVTVSGIVISERDEQFIKVPVQMVVIRVSSRRIEESFSQPANAYSPIVVTDFS